MRSIAFVIGLAAFGWVADHTSDPVVTGLFGAIDACAVLIVTLLSKPS